MLELNLTTIFYRWFLPFMAENWKVGAVKSFEVIVFAREFIKGLLWVLPKCFGLNQGTKKCSQQFCCFSRGFFLGSPWSYRNPIWALYFACGNVLVQWVNFNSVFELHARLKKRFGTITSKSNPEGLCASFDCCFSDRIALHRKYLKYKFTWKEKEMSGEDKVVNQFFLADF